MPTIDANGLRIGYDVEGAGPPLILLHGATSVATRDFRGQLPSLLAGFRCLMPDARGHGRTRWDTAAGGFSADWLADDALAFADTLELDTFHLLGFSLGAMTALRVAVRAPERLRTLVVVGISTEREPRASVARRLMDPIRIDRADPTWAADLARRHDPGQGEGAWRALLPAIAADVETQSLLTPRQVRAIDPPTLVAVGDRDPFVPVDHAWRLARSVLDGRLLVLPDAGHEALVERPTIATAALGDFYRSTEAVARQRAGTTPQEATR
ncbi:MAG: alpha/beta fold hydrolase [Candidatus Limnocylindrales bacterium]